MKVLNLGFQNAENSQNRPDRLIAETPVSIPKIINNKVIFKNDDSKFLVIYD